MTSTRHEDFAVELAVGAYGASDLSVTAVRGSERLSGGYSFSISFASRVEPKKLAALLGADARLTLGPAAKQRCFGGIVAAVSSSGEATTDHRRIHALRLVPRAFRLRHRRDSRIFQHVTIEQVVKVVLDAHSVAHRFDRTKASPVREFITQFDETDHAFVHRLLAEAGIFHFFEQPAAATEFHDGAAGETLVMSDEVAAYFPIGEDSTLRLHENAQMVRDDETVHRFAARLSVRSDAATFRDYDRHRPGARLRANATASRTAALEIYEHHGRHLSVDWEHDQGRAALRLAQARKLAEVCAGSSACTRLTPGGHFRLEDERGGGQADGEYVVTHVSHHVTTVAGHGATYENAFRCVPRSTLFVPTPRRRPKVHSCLTATVVGPEGEEIFVNGLGEIMVQFTWDRLGKQNEHSSCWLRVMQPWAGAQYGVQFTPRVGMEVIVGFDGGDPNKPVVLGTVNNGTHGATFALKDKTKSGFVTKTYGGHGQNSLVFDDANGREQIELHGQRDVELVAGNDYEVAVGGRASMKVTGNHSLDVKGAHKEQIAGMRFSSVNGMRVDKISGSLHESVGGNATHEIDGDFNVRARQRVVMTAETGMSVTVGTAAKPTEQAVYVHGRTTLGSSDTVQITATKTIEFLCGTSILRLKPDGIEIDADTLTLKAKKSISASSGDKGPSLVIDDQATLKSKKVSVLAEKASLQMDDQGVKLHGEQIQLDCAPDKPTEPKTDEEKAKTKKMVVQLTDADLKPLANMKYHVQVAGQKLEGTTDGDGVVEQTVPVTAAAATIMLWPKDYPTGDHNQYEVELLESMPPVESVRGAKTRLRNLGYYKGAVDDVDNGAFHEALSTLQLDFGLPRSGTLDADTLQQLERVHTS